MELPEDLQPELTGVRHAHAVAAGPAAVEKAVPPDEGAADRALGGGGGAAGGNRGRGVLCRGRGERGQEGVLRQCSAKCRSEVSVEKARGVGAGARVGEGRGGVELQGGVGIVVPGGRGRARAVGEALAGEVVRRIRPAGDVHDLVLVLREEVKPPGLMGTEVSLLLQPL